MQVGDLIQAAINLCNDIHNSVDLHDQGGVSCHGCLITLKSPLNLSQVAIPTFRDPAATAEALEDLLALAQMEEERLSNMLTLEKMEEERLSGMLSAVTAEEGSYCGGGRGRHSGRALPSYLGGFRSSEESEPW